MPDVEVRATTSRKHNESLQDQSPTAPVDHPCSVTMMGVSHILNERPERNTTSGENRESCLPPMIIDIEPASSVYEDSPRTKETDSCSSSPSFTGEKSPSDCTTPLSHQENESNSVSFFDLNLASSFDLEESSSSAHTPPAACAHNPLTEGVKATEVKSEQKSNETHSEDCLSENECFCTKVKKNIVKIDVGKTALLKKIHYVPNKHYVAMLGHKIAYIAHDNAVYISCDIFMIFNRDIPHAGYRKVDKLLLNEYKGQHVPFLCERKKRSWILKEALLIVLQPRTGIYHGKVLRQLLAKKIKNITLPIHKAGGKSHPTSTNSGSVKLKEVSSANGQPVTPDKLETVVTLCDMEIPMITDPAKGEAIFMEMEKAATYIGFQSHIHRRGWKYIDACLLKNNIAAGSAFIKKSGKRTHIDLKAFQVLLKKIKVGSEEKRKQFLDETERLLMRLTVLGLNVLHSSNSTSRKSPSARKQKLFAQLVT